MSNDIKQKAKLGFNKHHKYALFATQNFKAMYGTYVGSKMSNVWLITKSSTLKQTSSNCLIKC